jgi:uncharacterized protein YcbK (DUF882 family)
MCWVKGGELISLHMEGRGMDCTVENIQKVMLTQKTSQKIVNSCDFDPF